MNLGQKEAVCTTFLGIASRDLEEGRYLHAYAIFGALAQTDFQRQNVALQGEAHSLAKLGNFRVGLAETEKMFKNIIKNPKFAEQTVYKADNLRALAEVSIVLQHFDDIDAILEEAAQIYDYNVLTKANGSIVHLQGIVALWRQDFATAWDKIAWASTLSMIKVPDTVPSGFGIEAPVETSMEMATSVYALAGTRD